MLYPLIDDPKLKRLAARAGRAFGRGNHRVELRATQLLKVHLESLGSGELTHWSQVAMIDPRFNGATGQGGYWAAASRIVNELSMEILKVRSIQWKKDYGDEMFVEI